VRSLRLLAALCLAFAVACASARTSTTLKETPLASDIQAPGLLFQLRYQPADAAEVQRVARQHRRHLVKGDMGGGPAPPQIVIIHAGQIVMHQGVGVQRLDRRAHPQGARIIHPEQPRRMQHQEGPEPLAAGHDGVAHGLLHPGLAAFGARQHRVQGGIDEFGAGGDSPIQLVMGQMGHTGDPPWGRFDHPGQIIGHNAPSDVSLGPPGPRPQAKLS